MSKPKRRFRVPAVTRTPQEELNAFLQTYKSGDPISPVIQARIDAIKAKSPDSWNFAMAAARILVSNLSHQDDVQTEG